MKKLYLSVLILVAIFGYSSFVRAEEIDISSENIQSQNIIQIDNFSSSPDIDTQKPVIENVYLHSGATYNVDFDNSKTININNNNLVINVVFSRNDYPLNSSIVFWDMSKADPMVTPTDISYYKKFGYSKSFDLDTTINFDLTDLNLPDGNYRAMILAEDLAGNKIDFYEKTFAFTIDTIAPEAPVITSPISQ